MTEHDETDNFSAADFAKDVIVEGAKIAAQTGVAIVLLGATATLVNKLRKFKSDKPDTESSATAV